MDRVLEIRATLRKPETTPEERTSLLDELAGHQLRLTYLQGESPLILPSVDEQAVASVVQDWTGVPVGRMVKNEIETVLNLAETLNQRVIGQRHALDMIARRIQTSRARLDNPQKPIGVFMLCGPSGVGKTETALALAEALYGGEQNVISINMSEFQEAHTVSTLKGSPPGYVGYGEGGILTEAVRRRPYSVVLLDEIEKAHSDVHELFFQVFDKGWMEDSEGRYIDFTNTIILLTSNVGTDRIVQLCKDPELMPDAEGVAKALREPLLQKFPPALLGRLVAIPYYPLSDEILSSIVRLQLERIAKRVVEHHKIPFAYDDEAVKLIVSRCTEVESGGRMIDTILTNTVLPAISREFLTRTMAGVPLTGVRLAVANNDFDYRFEGQPLSPPAGPSPRLWGPEMESLGTAHGGTRDRDRASRDRGIRWNRIRDPGSDPGRRSGSTGSRIPDPGSRILTVDDAMAIAIQCQKNGHLAAAEDIYRAILDQAPDHADAMHYAGVVAHQQGRSDEALALIEKSLALAPARPTGTATWASSSRRAAGWRRRSRAFRQAIALDPRHVNAYNNLGVLLRAQGHADESEAAYRAAIAIDPDHQDVHQNLGILFYGQRRMKEAVACFCKVITLDPKHGQALRLLAMRHCVIGEFDKAVEICERWVAAEPADPLARHTLAACSGRDVPPRASDAYVEAVFDSFAASFDAKLALLMYRAPRLVTTMLADSGIEPAKTLDVLDAGCGTGLCGPLLTEYAARLVGVDLSARMLDQARERGVYDELVKGELTAYLQSSPRAFDVIVSADTLVYFGELEDVIAAAAGALRPDGYFVFTVEELVGEEDGAEYCLRPHGRYNHAPPVRGAGDEERRPAAGDCRRGIAPRGRGAG